MLNHDTLRAQTQDAAVPARRRAAARAGRPGADAALIARSPMTGGELGRIAAHTPDEVAAIVGRAADAFAAWRLVPGPVRGQLVREFGELLREHKEDLGALVSIEAGKIRSEGLRRGAGDDRHLRPRRRPVPPAVRPHDRLRAPRPPDDGAVAPARRRRRDQRVQLPGRGLVVEHRARPGLRRHRGLEAVGEDAADRARLPGAAGRGGPPGRRARAASAQLVLGGAEVGEALVDDQRVALVSATGSTRMGRAVAPRGGRRASAGCCSSSAATTPRSSRPSADLDLDRARHRLLGRRAPPGSAAPRCAGSSRTRSIADELTGGSRRPTGRCRSARRWRTGTLVGPLIDAGRLPGLRRRARRRPRPTAASWSPAARAGAGRRGAGRALRRARDRARCPRRPTSCSSETFAPILYVLTYDDPRRGDRAAQRRAAGPVVVDLHPRPARGRALHCRPTARTAGSPTSTSGRRAPRSAARSAARRRPAAAASPARTPGGPTCAARPTRSTTPTELPLAQGVSFG